MDQRSQELGVFSSESAPWDVDGTILHVGSVDERLLSGYLSSTATQIYVVDADPLALQSVEDKAQRDKRLETSHRVISSDHEWTTFYIYSQTAHNGLQPPQEVQKRYPGVQLVKEVDVETCSVESLLEQVAMSEAETHCLVVNSVHIANQVLMQFGGVVSSNVRPRLVVLGNLDIAEQLGRNGTLRLLYSRGYSITEVLSLHEDFTLLMAQPTSQIKELSDRLRESQGERDECREKFEDAKQKFRERLAELEAQQQIELAEAKNRWDQQQRRDKSQTKEEVRLRDEQDSQLAELRDDLVKAQEQLASSSQELEEADQRMQKIAKRNTALRTENQLLKAEEEELKKRQKTLDAEILKVEVQLQMLKELLVKARDDD
ncbi:hypothetical protein [Nesterenkonia natronophila]|uniref:Uncharacterized protein n=1 Tax=Nesterenkonia natronophila TaxID=2174932 RepID=A0A3A4F586_9MICC|nr:hypothetical protein [Nesterenkonia natronophila]RJN32966.1 hypothetical protein D3250_03935 [Nesterenkonia natronophila]